MFENVTVVEVTLLFLGVVAFVKGWDWMSEWLDKKIFGSSKKTLAENVGQVKKLAEENECRKREIVVLSSTLSEIQTTSLVTLESILALINHEIDGNGKEEMKKVRNKLQNELIKIR